MTRTEKQKDLTSVRALRLRAREMDQKRALALRRGDREWAQDLRHDARHLRRIANVLYTEGGGAAIRLIDTIFDTAIREEANVALVAGGTLAGGEWLSERGRRDAKNLRARVDRRKKVARVFAASL